MQSFLVKVRFLHKKSRVPQNSRITLLLALDLRTGSDAAPVSLVLCAGEFLQISYVFFTKIDTFF